MRTSLSEQQRERVPRISIADGVPLHPVLTDVPVATYSLAPIFDAVGLLGRSESAGAAGLWSAAAGTLWALPTAATGLLDYLRAPTGSAVKPIGRRHALVNTAALLLMAGSLAARRLRARPTVLSTVLSAGAGASVVYSSHLGGILVYREGMRVAPAGRHETGRPSSEAVAPFTEAHAPAATPDSTSAASSQLGVREAGMTAVPFATGGVVTPGSGGQAETFGVTPPAAGVGADTPGMDVDVEASEKGMDALGGGVEKTMGEEDASDAA
jgi:uncharacterized membrane protein